MKEPCMCGAPDCRRCFPGNFRRGVYVAEMTEEEEEELEDDCDEPDDDPRDSDGDSLIPEVAAAEFGGMEERREP